MTAPGGDEEDVTVRLKDEFSVPARTTREEAELLDKAIKRLNRTLLAYNKRVTESTAKTLEFAAALKTASAAADPLGEKLKHNNETIKDYNQTIKKSKDETEKAAKATEKHADAAKKDEKEQGKLLKVLKGIPGVLGKIWGPLFMVGKGFALLGAAGGILLAVKGAVAFISAASNLLAIAGLLPVALFSLVAAFMTLKVATGGVGDAIKALASGDAAGLEAALKKLSPAAQQFVKSIKPFLPQFKAIKQAAQQNLFAPLNQGFTDVLTNLLPIFKTGMSGIANVFGSIGLRIEKFLASIKGKRLFSDIFDSGRISAANFGAAAVPILTGLSDVVHAMKDNWTNLTAEIGRGGVKFGEWLSKISTDGSLEAMFKRAVDFAKQLWSTGKDIWSIFHGLGNILKAGFDSTGLTTFIKLAAEFVNSAQGFQDISQIFDTLAQLGSAVAPLFNQLADVLLQSVIPAIAPIVNGLAPGLVALVTAIGQGLQMLTPLWGPLAEAITAVLTALTPILPVLGQFLSLVGKELTLILQYLAAILPPVVEVLSTLFGTWLGLVNQLASALLPLLIPLIQQMADSFTQFAPVLAQIAQVFQDQFAAVLPELAQNFVALIPPLLQVGQQLLPALLQVILAILPELPDLIGSALSLVVAFSKLLPAIVPLIPVFIQLIQNMLVFTPVVVGVIWILAKMATAFFATLGVVINFVVSIIAWFAKIPGEIISALAGVVSAITSPFRNAKDNVIGIINDIRGAISDLMRSIGGVGGALSKLNPFKAFGGPVVAGQPYTVGEIGKEMFVPNIGTPYMIGQHGMETRTFGSAGTVIPSFMLESMDRMAKSAERHAAQSEAAAAQQGDRIAAMSGARRSEGAGDTHYTTNQFSFDGAVFKDEIDVEKAVLKALKKAERDKKERR